MILHMDVKVQGFFRLQVTGQDGRVHTDTGWFPNLITNQGMDWFGAGAPNFNTTGGTPLCTHCGVGTGTTTPAFTDTALTTPLAMSPPTAGGNVEGISASTFVAGPPAYWSNVKTYGFALGAVVGNISEVAVGNCANGNTTPQAFNHALIVDSGGNPTTISVLVTDALTVTYELRYYINTTDTAYSGAISAVTYSGIYRRATVGSVPSLFYQIEGIGGIVTQIFSGTIGAITSSPSGSVAGANSIAASTYVPGTLFKSFTATYNSGTGNFGAGGITAMLFSCNQGLWQFSLSPFIPKTNLFTLTLQFNVSWARFP